MVKKAVCLISGGLDSCVSVYIAKKEHYDIYALSFCYGQRHSKEIDCAKNIAKSIKAKKHIIFDVENRTGNKIIIHGYRMYRISPEGVKDVFWKGTSKKPNEFNRWVSDPHTNQILWNEEKHTFNWNDTNLIEDYGINKKGKWKTEVKIAYFEENSNTLSSAVGETYIDFE